MSDNRSQTDIDAGSDCFLLTFARSCQIIDIEWLNER